MFEPQRLPMQAEEFEIARCRMLSEISARAVQLRERQLAGLPLTSG